jgi:hypothetical protein
MFKITMGKGFQMTFNNGLTISVQIGAGNYCDNRCNSIFEESKRSCGEYIIQSSNAEIAIWDSTGKWITGEFTDKGDGSVVGWLNVEEVFEIMEKVKNYNIE